MTAAEAAQMPDTEAVDLNEDQAQALALKPTPTKIERVISAMVGSGPLRSADPAPDVPLWWVTAYDPDGHHRGIGTDVYPGQSARCRLDLVPRRYSGSLWQGCARHARF